LKKADVKKIEIFQEVKKIFLIFNDYYLKKDMTVKDDDAGEADDRDFDG